VSDDNAQAQQGLGDPIADTLAILSEPGDQVLAPKPDAPDKQAGADPDGQSLSNGEAEPGPLSEKPAETPKIVTTLKGLAEAAGIDVSDLYALNVGFGNGEEPMSLGAMKDRIKDGLDLDSQQLTLAEERRGLQNEILKARRELTEVYNQMNATPEQIETARGTIEANKQREQTALFEAVPELGLDPDLRKQVHIDVTKLVGDYGISAAEIDGVVDHRQYKLLMDFAALKSEFAKANALGKKVRKDAIAPASQPKGKSGGESKQTAQLVERATETGLIDDQVSAVAAILGDSQK